MTTSDRDRCSRCHGGLAGHRALCMACAQDDRKAVDAFRSDREAFRSDREAYGAPEPKPESFVSMLDRLWVIPR